MQLICKNSPTPKKRALTGPIARRRRALTLLELIVVLAILVTLSGMVVPLIEGLGHQTNASTNATVVNDVNRAIGSYVGRFEKLPSGWDSLISSTGGLYSKLHKQLTSSSLILQTTTITETQAQSLASAGIYQVYDAVEGGGANTFTPSIRNVAGGITLAVLSQTSKTGAFNAAQFSLTQLEAADANNDFVVLGLGGQTNLRGATMRDVPLISSADPNNCYARVLCVFMVPNSSTGALFPAKYIGCFLPDGTSQRMNLEQYNNARNGDSE